MSERGWLKEVLHAAKADVDRWPDWMKNSPSNQQGTPSGNAACREAKTDAQQQQTDSARRDR
jgi:hypothetical protein